MPSRRFTQGRIGQLGFEHVNEMMMGLDVLAPLIEEGGRRENTDTVAPKPRFMLVHATPDEAEPEKYDWDEIAFDVVDKPIINPSEVLDKYALRQGRVSQGTHGVSLTEGWEGGYAIAKVVKNTSGAKRYVLAPVAPSVSIPVEVLGVTNETYTPLDGITMNLYEVAPVAFNFTTEGPTIEPTTDSILVGVPSPAINLAEYGDNIPPATAGTLSVYPIQPGTRVLAKQYPLIDVSGDDAGTTGSFYVFSMMNRLVVEC